MKIEGIEPAPARTGLADQLKARTWSLHREAERSGILQDLLRGRAGRGAYVMLLRNLLPAYEALEEELERARAVLGGLADPAVYRAPAIRADLRHLAGPDWTEAVPLLPSAAAYARRIGQAAAIDPVLLVPHAYVRTLGDLNGGQILRRLLGESLGLGAAGLSFYDFPGVGELRTFAVTYRSMIDAAATGALEPVLAEGMVAFRLNIAISEAVKQAVSPTAAVGGQAPA